MIQVQEDDTHRIIIEIPPEEIVFVDQIFKSYEGLAKLKICEKGKGVVYLEVTNTTHDRVLDIINDFKNQFSVKILKEE